MHSDPYHHYLLQLMHSDPSTTTSARRKKACFRSHCQFRGTSEWVMNEIADDAIAQM